MTPGARPLEKTSLCKKRLKVRLWARTNVGDDLSRRRTAQTTAGFKIAPFDKAGDETGGELVARTCGIDRGNRRDRHMDLFRPSPDRHAIA